jgi:hypothetical protein
MSNIFPITDRTMIRQIKSLFPEYRGRKFYLKVSEVAYISAFAEGGSHCHYRGLNLETGEATNLVSLDEEFGERSRLVNLTPSVCVFRWEFFCGKNLGITAIVHPESHLGRAMLTPTLD